MDSTGAGAAAEVAGTPGAVDLLASAAFLRWVRPDLTAALADHVLGSAAADRDRWLGAAGWALHGRSATGDGREQAVAVLEGLHRWGDAPLTRPAAHRLRIELALVAIDVGEVSQARTLLRPVTEAGTEPVLRADAHSALARCAMDDAPHEVTASLRNAEAAWSVVDAPCRDIGASAVALLAAAAHRRAGRSDAAAEAASDGLAQLERGRDSVSAGTPSGHLAAALAAEWISALLDAGRTAEARHACEPLAPRLAAPTRPSKQLARLRLAVARATAPGAPPRTTTDALAQAAQDATDSDAPDLEAVSRSALGAVLQQSGQADAALDAVRAGIAAERRDHQRGSRFRAALAAVAVDGAPGGSSGAAAPDIRRTSVSPVAETPGRRGRVLGDRAINGGHALDTGRALDTSRSSERVVPSAAWPWIDLSGRDEVINSRRGTGTAATDKGTSSTGASGPRSGGRADGTTSGRVLGGDSSGRDRAGRDSSGGAKGRDSSGRDSSGRDSSGRDSSGRDSSGRDRAAADGLQHGGLGDETLDDEAPAWPAFRFRDEEAQARRSEGQNDEPRVSEARHSGASPLDDLVTRSRRVRGRAAEPAESGEGAGRPRNGRHGVQDGNGGNRVATPWATGSWSPARGAGASGAAAGSGLPVDAVPDRAVPDRAVPDRAVPDRAVPDLPGSGVEAGIGEPSGGTPATSEPDRWLQEALADLDRVWGRAPDRPRAVESPSGCTVVVDVARDGRRFAGPRAAVVVQAAAERLAGRLPMGARLHHDDANSVSVVSAGWDQDAATEWMHRSVPGLLEDFTAGGDLRGLRLRAGVRNADGPVGAQLLQRLDRPAWSDGRRSPDVEDTLETVLPEQLRRTLDPGDQRPGERRPGERRPGERRPGERRPGERGPGERRPGVRRLAPLDAEPEPEPQPGRHDAGGRTPFGLLGHDVEPGSGGRRYRRDVESPAAADGPTDADEGSIDGLGLADLLAGALAAYRRI